MSLAFEGTNKEVPEEKKVFASLTKGIDCAKSNCSTSRILKTSSTQLDEESSSGFLTFADVNSEDENTEEFL